MGWNPPCLIGNGTELPRNLEWAGINLAKVEKGLNFLASYLKWAGIHLPTGKGFELPSYLEWAGIC